MKKYFIALFAALPFFVAANAFAYEIQNEKINTRIEVPVVAEPVEAAVEVNWQEVFASQPVREWVVMYYINHKGKDNDEKIIKTITSLENIGSDNKIAFIAEAGRDEKYAKRTQKKHGVEFWSGTNRYFIDKAAHNGLAKKFKSPVIFKQGDINMGSAYSVSSFVNWVKERFPAKNYMLVMDTPGTGVMDPYLHLSITKGISIDYSKDSYIETKELTGMLAAMGGIDVMVHQAQSMQMTEVLYQERTHAKFIVGSYPNAADYINGASALKQNPAANPKEASRLMAQNAYIKNGIVSAVEAQKLNAVISSLNEFTLSVMAMPKKEIKNAVKTARSKVSKFEAYDNRKPYADLGMFVSLLADNTTSGVIKRNGEKFLSALALSTVAKKADGSDYSKGYGLAVNLLPMNRPMPNPPQQICNPQTGCQIIPGAPIAYQDYKRHYTSYPFAQETNWGKFYGWLEDF